MTVKIYTAEELAKVLDVNYRKVLELVKEGKIKTLDGIKGKVLVSEYQLDDYLRGK